MTSFNPRRTGMFAATLLALGLTASAAHAAAARVSASPSAGGLEVRIDRAAPAYQLRVVGPDGRVFEDSFLAGEPMLVQPGKLGYGKWLEGSYRYEVTPVLGDRVRSEAESLAGRAAAPAAQGGSGSFRVLGGKLLLSQVSKETTVRDAGTVAPMDVVNADDVIVQGSICVGFDCVDGESFGFDTIRMKENNTRIKFDDTSVGAFPATDWQLTANDSASGGLNRFSIEDITSTTVPFTIAGAAPTNSVFVSNNGNIGLGTSTPGLNVHIQDTDTPAHRLEQTGAGGFTPQTWDIAGNEANFFVRDLTGGSRLPFRIRPGAPTSAIDINAQGNVGMGSASPATALHVQRSAGQVALRLQRTAGTAPGAWDLALNSDSGRLNLTDDSTSVRVPVKFGVGAANNLLRVGIPAVDTVEVNGNLRVNGNIQVTGSVGPDYVFAPGFRLPTIGEHAAFMWDNKHLPRVGPAKVNEDGQGVIDLGTLSHGMLEELEYAHVYIAELDGTVQELRQQVEAKDEAIEQLRAEVEAIKRALGHD